MMRDPADSQRRGQQAFLQIKKAQLTQLLPVNIAIFRKKHTEWQSAIQITKRPGQR